MILSSVIAGEMERMGGKMDFWRVDHLSGETLWQSDKPLSLEEALSMIDPTDADLTSTSELGLLYGIGWEFVWEQTPPEAVIEMRDAVIAKVRCGMEISDLEKFWYELIVVDTDMF
jgi:hypothetical protein